MSDDERDEKLGRAIVSLTWLAFAAKFIIIVTAVALVILYFLKKPLWIAPVIGVGAFIIYRLIWRLFWKFIEWSGKQ
ncbi:MAG: hypothetical protein K6F73_05740 [Lachnospiraceae bacterium]|nr:hypothetical protein [Lachnospiraceae bacterium]